MRLRKGITGAPSASAFSFLLTCACDRVTTMQTSAQVRNLPGQQQQKRDQNHLTLLTLLRAHLHTHTRAYTFAQRGTGALSTAARAACTAESRLPFTSNSTSWSFKGECRPLLGTSLVSASASSAAALGVVRRRSPAMSSLCSGGVRGCCSGGVRGCYNEAGQVPMQSEGKTL